MVLLSSPAGSPLSFVLSPPPLYWVHVCVLTTPCVPGAGPTSAPALQSYSPVGNCLICYVRRRKSFSQCLIVKLETESWKSWVRRWERVFPCGEEDHLWICLVRSPFPLTGIPSAVYITICHAVNKPVNFFWVWVPELWQSNKTDRDRSGCNELLWDVDTQVLVSHQPISILPQERHGSCSHLSGLIHIQKQQLHTLLLV